MYVCSVCSSGNSPSYEYSYSLTLSSTAWWVPESREFDIAHDCVRPDCLQAQAAQDDGVESTVVENIVQVETEVEEEPHVVVETRT